MCRYEGLLVGAGTVLDVEQAKRAIGAGGTFIVAPGTNPPVVKYCLSEGIAITPGIATPSDIDLTCGLGLNVLKATSKNTHTRVIRGAPLSRKRLFCGGISIIRGGLKFFPAEAYGGAKTLKALGVPYGGVRFIPAGGVSTSNLADYLALPSVLACGGSWMVDRKLVGAGEFDRVRQRVSEAVLLANPA